VGVALDLYCGDIVFRSRLGNKLSLQRLCEVFSVPSGTPDAVMAQTGTVKKEIVHFIQQ
jgi:hypothetical protein